MQPLSVQAKWFKKSRRESSHEGLKVLDVSSSQDVFIINQSDSTEVREPAVINNPTNDNESSKKNISEKKPSQLQKNNSNSAYQTKTNSYKSDSSKVHHNKNFSSIKEKSRLEYEQEQELKQSLGNYNSAKAANKNEAALANHKNDEPKTEIINTSQVNSININDTQASLDTKNTENTLTKSKASSAANLSPSNEISKSKSRSSRTKKIYKRRHEGFFKRRFLKRHKKRLNYEQKSTPDSTTTEKSEPVKLKVEKKQDNIRKIPTISVDAHKRKLAEQNKLEAKDFAAAVDYVDLDTFSDIPVVHGADTIKLVDVSQGNKSTRDEEIQKLINKFLPGYERTTIYDIFPVELSAAEKEYPKAFQLKLIDYYDYVRADLKNISKSNTLKSIKYNFDLDGLSDYAVIVTNASGKTKLAILNRDKLIHLEDFSEQYLELFNGGRYPISFQSNGKWQKIYYPALKKVAFEEEKTKLLYYNRRTRTWQNVSYHVR
jgi:hypothetical protein